jgi:hypothetical protein
VAGICALCRERGWVSLVFIRECITRSRGGVTGGAEEVGGGGGGVGFVAYNNTLAARGVSATDGAATY